MIEILDDGEYITLVADLIKLIGNLDTFKLKVWLTHSETPFEFDSNDDFLFLNEGVRIHRKKDYQYIGKVERYSYLFYDNIANIQVVMDDDD